MRRKNILSIIIVVIAGIILLTLVSVQFISSRSTEPKEILIEINARKFSFTPNIIEVNKGDTVKIRFISEDVHHGFFLDGYQVNTSARPGQDGSLTFVADKTGRFSYRCSVACGVFHPYMAGYLTVVPNLRFSIFGLIIIFLGITSFVFITFLERREKNNGQG